jgi:menaquinone-specific isochorismate synthase
VNLSDETPVIDRVAAGRVEEFAMLGIGGGRFVCGTGPFESFESPPDDRRIAFYSNDFSLSDPKPWKVPAHSEISELPAELFSLGDAAVTPDWVAPQPGDWESVFSEVSGKIAADEINKAVPVVTEVADFPGATDLGAAVIGRLLAQPARDHVWGYGFCHEESGFAGLTPERLFSIEGRTLKTMALAGTAAPGDEAAFEIDPKEREEHSLVVDAMQRRLAEFGEVRTGDRVVLDLGGMLHFLTPIEVALDRDVDEGEIVRALHPTPAIGVQPRDRETLDWLTGVRDAQGTPAVFGAPFGVRWEGGMHMIVAIRCVTWQGDRLALPSGCGVVGASDCQSEWRELALKRAWVKGALGLA